MSDFRYAQFCALARATEILGERWTLLLVRELFLGPKRFSDFLRPLPGVSSSVLAERLAKLEERGVVLRRELPAPAAATVYELSESGRALLPVLVELTRWGTRFLEAPRPGDHFEAAWLRLGLAACARRGPTPPLRFRIAIPQDGGELAFAVAGGPQGTALGEDAGEVDAAVRGAPLAVLAFVAGRAEPEALRRSGALAFEGDAAALAALPSLFEFASPETRP